MAEAQVLDRAFTIIRDRWIATSQPPHYTDLAAALGCSVEEGRQTLHALLETGYPAWVYPSTDYLASFAPFYALPTQYRVSVDGRQNWFAQ